MRGRAMALALILGLAGVVFGGAARASEVADFYAGHPLTFVIGATAGGGYDLLVRFLADRLAARLPGHPRTIIENMPGAGGLTVANYLFKEAPEDGSVIGSLPNNVAFEPLFGTAQARFDAGEFGWIGSSNPETAFLVVRREVPVYSIADAQRRTITVGASGAASAPTFFARLLNETLRTKLKIIAGYPGSSETFLAIERGELDGYGSAFTSDLANMRRDLVRAGTIRPIVQYGARPDPDYPKVPFALDAIGNPADKALMQAGCALLAMGRPFAAPPNVPPARLAALRIAFDATVRDPAVAQQASRLGLEIDRAQTGDEIEKLVAQTYRTPPDVVRRLRTLRLR
jgi:tripartite-type tricarboxylate transporter receptor subunit TctC